MRANPFAGKHLAGRGCLQTAARSGSIVLITFIVLVVLYFLVTLTTSLFQLAGR